MPSSTATQEEVMGRAVPTQHPAVVLRSHYLQVRLLLAIAMIAVIGLTVAVVILATDDETTGSAPVATRSADTGRALATRPDESAVASAISKPAPPVARPDEAKVAAAVALRRRHADSTPTFRRQWPAASDERPDESTVAGAVSGR
jgi:hypothetical protein